MDGVEHLHLDARVLHGLKGGVGQPGEIAEVVEDDAHLHARRGPLFQHGKDPVPDLALCQDIVLQKDIDLRLPQVVDEIVKKRGAVGKITGSGIAVEGKPLFGQKGGQSAPLGRLPAQTGDVVFAVHPHALPLPDGGDLPQAQALCLMGAAPQAKEDHAGNRQSQQKAHPHQLIAGAAGAQIHPDSRHRAGKLQNCVKITHLFPQELGQQQRHGDLCNDGKGTHGKAGKSGNAPLCALGCLCSVSSHTAHLLTEAFSFIQVLYSNPPFTASNIL